MYTNIYKLIRNTQKTFIFITTNILLTLQKEIYNAYSMNITKNHKNKPCRKKGTASDVIESGNYRGHYALKS